MKANYTKPLFSMEMFTMVQSAARDCADFIPTDMLTSGDISKCGWLVDGAEMLVFLTPEPCTMDGEAMNFACYNNPSEGNYIFRS